MILPAVKQPGLLTQSLETLLINRRNQVILCCVSLSFPKLGIDNLLPGWNANMYGERLTGPFLI